MFRKKIVLFGKAVPFSLIAILLTVTLAGAAWGGILAFTTDFAVSTSTDSGDTVNRLSDACQVVADQNTGVDPTLCDALTDPNGNLTINIENASPGDEYRVVSLYSAPNTNSNILYAQPLDVSAWGKVLDLVQDNGCGTVLQPGGGSVQVSVNFQFDADGLDTDPTSSYGPFSVVREFATTVPTCP